MSRARLRQAFRARARAIRQRHVQRARGVVEGHAPARGQRADPPVASRMTASGYSAAFQRTVAVLPDVIGPQVGRAACRAGASRGRARAALGCRAGVAPASPRISRSGTANANCCSSSGASATGVPLKESRNASPPAASKPCEEVRTGGQRQPGFRDRLRRPAPASPRRRESAPTRSGSARAPLRPGCGAAGPRWFITPT